MARGGAAR